MPNSEPKPPSLMSASVPTTSAKPPHTRLNGTRNMSAFVKRLAGSGAPIHSMRSPGERSRPTTSGSTDVATALAAVALPGFEALAQVAEEASRVRAVDEAVVVRQRDVHQRPDRDDVLAQLVRDHPRALH